MKFTNNCWVRYRWNLKDLVNTCLSVPKNFTFDKAEAAEKQQIIEVVIEAYSSDPVWRSQIADIKKRMTGRVEETIGQPNSAYIVARQKSKIVAVSGIAKAHRTDQNLLTGICVLPDFQRRGLGKFLLGQSLSELKSMGLNSARVYTEEGSLADLKIYPLFGSKREAGVNYPGAE